MSLRKRKNARASRATVSPFRTLPCLKCATTSVVVMVPAKFQRFHFDNLICNQCSAPHWLRAHLKGDNAYVVYDRDTRRYPPEFYDDNPVATIVFKDASLGTQSDTPFPGSGPIIVFKRRRLSGVEIRDVWRSSGRKCHICGKTWRLKARSKTGWHVDHVIPNIGGGMETEALSNFKVACARCNLKKGRGHTPRIIREALKKLFKLNG